MNGGFTVGINREAQKAIDKDIEENKELYEALADIPDEDWDVQDVVEEVDDILKEGLEHANTHMQHEEVRPSAVMAFDKIEEAREKLDEIDERDFKDE